ncbi:MAG: HlyC/CorC family transporter [Eubacterium sp.]|nr:HlyC/CorC family transporter [Eubacterium sp.]
MDTDPWIGRLILQIALIAVNAVFACAEIAVISMSDTKLEKLEEEGNRHARMLRKLTAVPARFLATIQVAITLSGFLGSAFAADAFAGRLTAGLAAVGIRIPESAAIVIITIILSYVTLVCGELVPKRLAMKNPEKVSLGLSGLLYFVSVIFYPLVALLTASTNGVLRLFGVDPEAEEEEVTEEEIRMMVDAGGEKGTIDEDEQEMIQNVFEFDDLSVEEICTHRKDAVILYMEDSLEEWQQQIHQSRHSRFPVCRETADHVVGILDAKDFFRLNGCSKEEIMEQAVDPAYFVPGTLKADVLLRNMKMSGRYFAVVLDEYGGMDGIISLRDLIEQLVGDLVEEDEVARPEEIVRITDTTWKIQGSASLDDVAEELHVTLPVDEYDTFGGYIFGVLGSVPDDGSKFELDSDGLHIRVLRVSGHRVEGSIVTKQKEERVEE